MQVQPHHHRLHLADDVGGTASPARRALALMQLLQAIEASTSQFVRRQASSRLEGRFGHVQAGWRDQP